MVILAILAGVKPLEEAYRARNQTCVLRVEAEHGALTPDILRQSLSIRPSQLKRFVVERSDPAADDEVMVMLGKVSSQDIADFTHRLKEVEGVRHVRREKR